VTFSAATWLAIMICQAEGEAHTGNHFHPGMMADQICAL